MIIGFDASRAFTKNKTGTENYSYQLLKHLLKLDQINNYYIYLRPGMDNMENVPKSQIITIPFPRLWTQAGLALQTFKDPLDLLFIPSHTLPLVRKPGLKTVVTVHDLGAEYLPTMHQIKQRLYLNFMTYYQLKSATHLIAVSEATKKDLINIVGIPASKITVVYEGYDREKFKVQSFDKLRIDPECNRMGQKSKIKISQTLKQYNLQYQNYFLFVGTIQPRKNLERLIRAYALLLNKDVQGVVRAGAPHRAPAAKLLRARTSQPKLVLAGGKGWLSDDIYQLPRQLGIEEYVKFLGFVPDEKLPALYSGAISFLFPSLYEGFGLPILEAFACGCPVLTSNTSSMPEVAGKAALLVNPYSIEDITQGIKRMMNEKIRIKNIELGYKQLEKFSWEKTALETMEVLQSV